MSEVRRCDPLFSSTQAGPVKICKHCGESYSHGLDAFCSTAHELRYIEAHSGAQAKALLSSRTDRSNLLDNDQRMPWPEEYSRVGEKDAYRRKPFQGIGF